MYQLIKFVKYRLQASHKRGHGIHSPFMFKFVTEVLNNNTSFDEYSSIRRFKQDLIKSGETFDIDDIGAPSKVFQSKVRTLKELAKYISVPEKYLYLLFRISKYYKADTTIELGGGTGISALSLYLGNPETNFTTIEGHTALANRINREIPKFADTKNFSVKNQLIDQVLPQIKTQGRLLVFIDANHTKDGVCKYVNYFLNADNEDSIIILDDIYLSKEMTNAWEQILEDYENIVTIDLFRFGIIFKRQGTQKQHYKIKF